MDEQLTKTSNDRATGKYNDNQSTAKTDDNKNGNNQSTAKTGDNQSDPKTGNDQTNSNTGGNQSELKNGGNKSDSKTDDNQPDSNNDDNQSAPKAKPSLLDQTKSNETTSEWIRKYFGAAMGIYEVKSRLDEVSFEGIARYITSDKCQKIVTLTGAGISTSAGIPDFRTPGTGVYDRLKEHDIPDPQRVFQLEYFTEHPDIVYSMRKEIFCGAFKPTPCHYFVKLLQTKNKLSRHFTQNIDGLDIDAGLDPDLVVQAHGTCHTYHCMKCKHPYTKQHMTEVLKDESLKVPLCTQTECEGVIRPDIVFFGESLPPRFGEKIPDIEHCDMMIIMGTSLIVQPFAALTSRTLPDVPRLYINLEKTGREGVHPISALMFGGSFDFDSEKNVRDVFWQGTCDDGCYALADLLGWGDELRNLVSKEHTELDKKLGIKTGASKTPASKTNIPKTNVSGKSQQTSRIPPRSTTLTPKPKTATTDSKPNTNTKTISASSKQSTPLKPSSSSKLATGSRSTTLSKTSSSLKK